MNLARMKPGERATITKIGVTGSLKRRLMDMGVLVGEDVKVEKVAPPRRPYRGNNQELQIIPQKERGRGNSGGGGKVKPGVSGKKSKSKDC